MILGVQNSESINRDDTTDGFNFVFNKKEKFSIKDFKVVSEDHISTGFQGNYTEIGRKKLATYQITPKIELLFFGNVFNFKEFCQEARIINIDKKRNGSAKLIYRCYQKWVTKCF